MNSNEATLFSEFNISNLSFGRMTKVNTAYTIPLMYNGARLQLQSPLMNTFGISQFETKTKDSKSGASSSMSNSKAPKWTLCLTFSEKGVNTDEITAFQNVLEQIENKVMTDCTKTYYRDWLNVGDAWDDFDEKVRSAMVKQKISGKLLKLSKNKEKNYPPTISLKMNTKKDTTDEFNVDIYKMDDANRIKITESGEYETFNAMEELYVPQGEKKIRPRVYCIFNMSIWIVNANIYLTANAQQILIQPLKSYSSKIGFNQRGFLKHEDYTEEEEEEDEDAPAIPNLRA